MKIIHKKTRKIGAQIMAVPLFYFHDLFYLNHLRVALFEKRHISQIMVRLGGNGLNLCHLIITSLYRHLRLFQGHGCKA